MSTIWCRGISGYADLLYDYPPATNVDLQFDGERDTKGPHDFSGTKAEDAGDDDDDGDEDDGRPKTNGKLTKPKIEASGNGLHRPSLHTDLTGGMDVSCIKLLTEPPPI